MKKSLQIHSENILPIIKRWLYSDKDIFVRELVSNACDAIHKVKILKDRGIAPTTDEEFKIEIQINKTERTLKFIDHHFVEQLSMCFAQRVFCSACVLLSMCLLWNGAGP